MPISIDGMKWLAAAVLFIAAFGGGLAPFLLKQRSLNAAARKAKAAAVAVGDAPAAAAVPSALHGKSSQRRSLQSDESSALSPLSSSAQVPAYSPPTPTDPTALGLHQVPPPIRIAGSGAASSTSGSASPLKSESFRVRYPEAAQRRRNSQTEVSVVTAATVSVAPAAASDEDAHSHRHHHRFRCHMDVDRFLSLGNMLGAGIFLGGGLLHLLPESAEQLSDVQKSWSGALGPLKDYPVAFFLAGMGFFTILVVEEITIYVTTRSREKKARAAAREADKRTEAEAAAQPPKQVTAPSRRKNRSSGTMLPGGTPASPTSSSPSPGVRAGMEQRYPDPHSSRSSQSPGRSRFRGTAVGSPGQRDLARNIVQGLTPRIMLLPAMPVRIPRRRRRPPTRRVPSTVADDVEASHSLQHGHAAPPVVLRPVDRSSSSDLSSSSDSDCVDGPIQQFLDAAYNSPSPFPSIADPLIARRLGRLNQHQRRGSFPPDDSDSNMRPMMHRGGACSGADSGMECEPGTPTAVYSASSRASAAVSITNAAAGRSEEQRVSASPVSGFAAPMSLGTTPSAVASMRLPLLQPLRQSSDEYEPSSSPVSTTAKIQQLQHDADVIESLGAPLVPSTARTSSRRNKRAAAAASHDQEHGAHGHGHDDKSVAKGGHGHGHGHGHGGEDGHSHINLSSDTSYIVAYLLVLALSFHSIFEGIALGTQDDLPTTVSIFIAVLAHSPLAGFALGVSLVKAKGSARMSISCLFLFSAMTPLGVMVGMGLSTLLSGDTLTTCSACFQSFSAGTFLFVALEEIIPKELAVAKDKGIKLFLCVLGFMMMAVIKIFDADHDDHDHAHE